MAESFLPRLTTSNVQPFLLIDPTMFARSLPAKRPGICGVMQLLGEARSSIREEESERNKYELVQAFQNQPCGINEQLLHSVIRCYCADFGVCSSRLRDRECSRPIPSA